MVQSAENKQQIGLLGGTFDPVHKGHLAVAEHVLHTLGLDAVWFIPAAIPPHKPEHTEGGRITDFQDRVTMLEKALAPFARFQINLVESERTSPSYSIETIIELQKRNASNTEFFFIVGEDAFAEIDTWKQYRELTDFVDLVIISRGENDNEEVEKVIREKFPDYQKGPLENIWYSENQKGLLKLVPMEPVPISSTMVRERVREGSSFSEIVPSVVEEYIRTKKIYR